MTDYVAKLKTPANRWLLTLFFLSGAAALIYQVCWQRLLFAAFGVDIESVTIIVSVFMFGLGLGALAGGALADRFPNSIVAMFSLVELGIGLFGLASPTIIVWVGDALVGASRFQVAAGNFALMSIPTVLMGATLPMLVAHLYRVHGNVGVSIGRLYFSNTMGACAGSFATGFLLFQFLDLHQTIQVAALCNLFVSASAYLLFRRSS
jgi:predicted membrane-bound spermidine synthase